MKITLSSAETAYSGELYYKLCMSDRNYLRGFFCWSQTRQGHSYWSERYLEIEDLKESDKLHLTLVYFVNKHNILEFNLSPSVCAMMKPSF